MRGGAQAHLMRCSDSFYYVVKFQNNPQHVRILANELLGTRLGARLGLPTAPPAVIEVSEELIAYSSELVVQLGMGRTACRAGLQFGSRYPGDPTQMPVHDFLPDGQLREVENLADFAGMLVFDKWTCNTNGRQAIFFLEPGRSRYQALMIDQGFCFKAGEWTFPDAPLRGLYPRHDVYESVRGMSSFEPGSTAWRRGSTKRPWMKRRKRFRRNGIISTKTRCSGCSNNSSGDASKSASGSSRQKIRTDNLFRIGSEPCLTNNCTLTPTGSCAIRRTWCATNGSTSEW